MPKRSIIKFISMGANRCKFLILMLLFGAISFVTNAQNVQVEARLDRVSIPIGDQTLLHVSAKMPVKTELVFPVIADSIGKVQIVKSLKADTLTDKNNQQTITHNYAVTSFDAGVYVLPGFAFHTKTGDLKTGTVTLQVKAVPVDTTKTFYDIKQPLAVSYTFWDWLKDHWLAIVSILAAILVVAALVYYYKKRPVKEALPVAAPVFSADVIALNKLNELRDKRLWQQNQVKLYYSELTDVLREYLEKRYQIKAHEQTTDEIFDGLLNQEITQTNRATLKQVLTLADLVKFAKQQPTAFENEQSLENALNFIVQTKHQPQINDNKELPK